jgi:hypothetical protein
MSLSEANWNWDKIRRPPKQSDIYPDISFVEVFDDSKINKLFYPMISPKASELVIGPKNFYIKHGALYAIKSGFSNVNLSDPSKKFAMWYVQPPFHSVIIYKNLKYALIAVNYARKLTDVRYMIERTINICSTTSRTLILQRATHLTLASHKWINSHIKRIFHEKKT